MTKAAPARAEDPVVFVIDDDPSMREALTLWTPKAQHQPALEDVQAHASFGRLLDRLMADMADPEIQPDDRTGLADGIRIVRLLDELAGSWREPMRQR